MWGACTLSCTTKRTRNLLFLFQNKELAKIAGAPDFGMGLPQAAQASPLLITKQCSLPWFSQWPVRPVRIMRWSWFVFTQMISSTRSYLGVRGRQGRVRLSTEKGNPNGRGQGRVRTQAHSV